MSTNLLQSSMKISRWKGIRLEFYLERKQRWSRETVDSFTCPECGKTHPIIYVAWRKPVDTFGHSVVFRYLGEEQVPDLSLPIPVPTVPRGAKKLSEAKSAEVWHK